MAGDTRATGSTTKCMVAASTNGRTEENTKESISWTKSTELASTPGQTAENTMANGPTANDTDRVK